MSEIYALSGIIGPFLENLVVFIAVFMIQKYVLLEKGLEKNKQKWFCIINGLISFILCCFNATIAQLFILLIGGINICLARKEHRIRGFFMIVPTIGIIDGFVIPLIIIPLEYLFETEGVLNLYGFFVLAVALLLWVIFCVKGKNWRRQFEEETKNRHLGKGEFTLICIMGVMMCTYSMTMSSLQFTYTGAYSEFWGLVKWTLVSNVCWTGAVALIHAITVIVLVMQGNKRAYYYDKALAMQAMEIEKQRAEAANEAKSKFLSTMSHEIRTPMNAIVGMTDILLREEHSKQTREYLNNIKNSGDALLTIINDILDFSKIESGKMDIIEDRYEPMSMFHDLSMIFFNRIGDKKVELLYDIDKKMPCKLYGDVQRIRQIIINLMNNAIKFTESGFVKLSVEVHTIDMENVELHFKVQDSGQGIKEEDIDKLFGSFSQVDKIRNHHKEGSGLGLAICKQLVELMHGEIGVESTYGVGSTFYFTVPQRIVDVREATGLKNDAARKSIVGLKIANNAVKNEIVKIANDYQIKYIDWEKEPFAKVDFLITDDWRPLPDKERETLSANKGILCVLQNPMKDTVCVKDATIITKPLYSLNFCQLLNLEEQTIQNTKAFEQKFTSPEAKILLVDDNEMNLKVAKGLLEPFKMQLDVARNGKEAIQKVLANKYHIVFMDHMMPVMDGVEATKAIRKLQGEEYKKLPIVALSANATAEAKEMFLKEKMDDFIAKPIKIKEMNQCLLKWLPNEIVMMGEQKETGDATASENVVETSEVLPAIEGLNVAEGIKNCGSKELFLSLLSDFYKLIDSKSEKVEKCLAEGLIRDYTIEVHALKSMARMIGALELSEDFYQMEQLGNAGEKEEIEKRTPEILQFYRSYKELLKEYAVSEEEEKTQVSYEQIEKTLMRLHDAMDGFDLDEADEAMKELESYEFSEDIKPMVQRLSVLVTDVAIEDVMKLTDEICEALASNAKTAVNDKANVMLVDDDIINIKTVKEMLKDEYNVVAVQSGKEAFEMLIKSKPDLILLDVYMPEMDGHDVIKALKENPEYVDIPVVFLTSDVEEHTEIQGFSEGAIDFLRKPFRKDVAIQRIRRILELSYLQKNLQQEVEKQTEVAENRRESVERLSWQMVQALANTIDAKDSYTNGHSTRVAQYSVMLAEKMGYTGEKLEQLQYAAMLHDIGKIGVPREIINKPSKLTDEEYAIIKMHPAIGENILKEVSEIPDIAIGARWHHERYDGKGYPDGLVGEEIPELARIIGVADAYDAMTSKRSYRDVLPQEVVAGELEKGKSTQFDPEIAELMIELIKEDTDYVMHE